MRTMIMEEHWGRSMRCYAERPPHLDAMFRAAAARFARQEAVVDGEERLSYAELDARVEKVASGLAALGIGAGDRVAILLGNRIEFIVCVLACARLAALIVPIGTRLRRPEIEYICSDAGVRAIVHEAALAGELPDGRALRFAVGGGADGSAPFEALMREAPVRGVTAFPEPTEEDGFGILYTSGTTGRPKGAVLTHLGAIHSALHWLECLGLAAGETTVLAIPGSHVAGLCGVVLPFLMIGGRIVLMREFRARAFLELAARERMSHALLVPAMYGLCLLEPDLRRYDLGAWRLGVYGSAPMPEASIHRLAEVLPQLKLCNAYGATETTSPATIMPPGDGVAHADSIGKVVPCGDIRVVDETGAEVPPGTAGELWIAGPMVIPCYWANDEANQRSFVDGFWKSGDIGTIDAQGYVRLMDRKKDMINRGGFKVYPAEVENVLAAIPGVVEAGVVGRPDPILTERVVAFVHGDRALLSEAGIKAYCAERMADYKVPDHVVICAGPLPRNANGKLQKDELRKLAREGARE